MPVAATRLPPSRLEDDLPMQLALSLSLSLVYLLPFSLSRPRCTRIYTYTRVCTLAQARIYSPRFLCFRQIRLNIVTTRLNFRPCDLDLISRRIKALGEITNVMKFFYLNDRFEIIQNIISIFNIILIIYRAYPFRKHHDHSYMHL